MKVTSTTGSTYEYSRVLNKLLYLIAIFLYRPKAYFLNPDKQKEIIGEPSIILSNHTCHMDGPVLNTVLRKNRIHTLAAKDRFEQGGIMGLMLRITGCIPIDRQNLDTSWIHEAMRILSKERYNVAIYPEGQHGSHRHLLPFHQGVVMLAAYAQVPIIMAYIDGPQRKWHRNKLIIAPPFRLDPPLNGINAEYLAAQTESLHHKMEDLMTEFIRRNDGKDAKQTASE